MQRLESFKIPSEAREVKLNAHEEFIVENDK